MKDFRQLTVWQKAHTVTLNVYQDTGSFPKAELYGLVSQMRRCSVSIGANIAEGCGRSNNGDFQRFLQTAMGSASELEYHLLLSFDLSYLPRERYVQLNTQLAEVKRMLVGLSRKVAIDRVTV